MKSAGLSPLRLALLLGIVLAVAIGMWSFSEPSPPQTKPTEEPAREPIPTSTPLGGILSDIPVADGPARAPAGADLISEIIANENLDFPSTVNRLLEILPGLDADSQAEAAQHAANLSEDATAALWTRMLVENQIPLPAAEVFFNDLLNRPHEFSMPALAAIADRPNHPLRKDSIDILTVLYGSPAPGSTYSQLLTAGEQTPAP